MSISTAGSHLVTMMRLDEVGADEDDDDYVDDEDEKDDEDDGDDKDDEDDVMS